MGDDAKSKVVSQEDGVCLQLSHTTTLGTQCVISGAEKFRCPMISLHTFAGKDLRLTNGSPTHTHPMRPVLDIMYAFESAVFNPLGHETDRSVQFTSSPHQIP
jgi:hypothetical protein